MERREGGGGCVGRVGVGDNIGESGRQCAADAGEASDCSRSCFSLAAESGREAVWGAMVDGQVQRSACCSVTDYSGLILCAALRD